MLNYQRVDSRPLPAAVEPYPEAAVSGSPNLHWGSFSFDRCSAEIDRCTEAGRTLKSARSRLVGEENFLKKSVGY